MERKERVIHTRVPERLEAQLRRRAEDLGISVSNLVRNVLGHAFGLVGDVVADSHAIARAARGEPVRQQVPPMGVPPGGPGWAGAPQVPPGGPGWAGAPQVPPGGPGGPGWAGLPQVPPGGPGWAGAPQVPPGGPGWAGAPPMAISMVPPGGPGWAGPPPMASGWPVPPTPSFDDVLGWQPIVLGKNAVCVRCNEILPRGTDAAVGLGTQLIACHACIEELRR